jgi:molybdopterin-guanine dinucleotide biosynthesis protein A
MALEAGSVPAVLLAGGRCPADLAEAAGVEARALLPFRGKLMLDWVVDALAGASCVGPMVVVGDAREGERYTVVPGGSSFLESIRNGMEHVDAERFLIATGDIPFLTSDAVQSFCEDAIASGGDFCWAIVPKKACDERFPGIRRTTVKLREEHVTGGNMALVNKPFLEHNWEKIAAAYAARKQKVKLAAMIGFGTLFRFAVGQAFPTVLPLAAIEAAASRLVGGKVKAILSPYAGVGTDIDNLDQWRKLDVQGMENRE